MERVNNFYSKVFMWLFIGLLITFATGYYTLTNEELLNRIFSGGAYWIIFIVQIVLCLVLSIRIEKMQPTTAKILYVGYTALTGLTFASIFYMFEMTSVMYILLATAVIFGIFALIGSKTKVDLNKLGTYLLIGLLVIIVLEVVNIFMLNSTLNMVTAIIGVIIFIGYIAYDMQRIGRMNTSGYGNENYAILGAFNLYLDFINLFIELLKIFGRERN